MPWRPRRPRRPLARRPARPRAGAAALRRLRRANALLAEGRFAEAAQAFDRLAEGALQRGLPQAPNLALRAAEAYLKAGNTHAARERALRGLEMLANTDRWPLLRRAGDRVVATLEGQGQSALANEIRQALEKWLAAAPSPPQQRQAAANLPATCPACGAPVHPSEVAWEAGRAFCPYCGTALH